MAEIDVVEKVVAMDSQDGVERFPIAGTQTPGLAQFDPNDFTVDDAGYVKSLKKAGAIQYIGQILRTYEDGYVWTLLSGGTKEPVDVELNDIILCISKDETNGNLYRVSQIEGATVHSSLTPVGNIRGPQGEIGQTGPRGPQGPKGDTGNTGPQGPGFNYVGAWVGGTNQYNKDDVVTYDGAAYVCYLAVTNSSVPPSQDPQHWDKFIEIPAGGEAVVLTGNSGTLTVEQYGKLYPYVGNYIVCNNEYYYFADDMSNAGYLMFTHLGYLNHASIFMKFITVMKNRRKWTNAVQQFIDKPQVYVHNLSFSALGTQHENNFDIMFSFAITNTYYTEIASSHFFDMLDQAVAFNRDTPIPFACSGVIRQTGAEDSYTILNRFTYEAHGSRIITFFGSKILVDGAPDWDNTVYYQLVEEELSSIEVYDNFYPIDNTPE